MALGAALALGAAGTALEQPEAPEVVPADEPQVVVVLHDGRRLAGVLEARTDSAVTIRIAGIRLTLQRTDIARLEVLEPVAVQHQRMLEAIGPQDAAGLVELARWALERERYDLAEEDLREALAIAPNDPEAEELLRLVVSLRELRRRAGTGEPSEAGAAARSEAEPDDAFPLLTAEQINLIKVFEIDLSDPPRLLIPREVVEAFLEAYAGQPEVPTTPEGRQAFLRRPAAEILGVMFRLRAREFYGRVEVLGRPRAMELFRNNVHRGWLLNGCATAQCHGGSEAGRLQLYTRARNSDATVYTNFLILERFRLADGTPLIDYRQPARSPLLQMGLPRERSAYPHPAVLTATGRGERWRPVFRSEQDRTFARAVQWIGTMYQPRPEYPIEYPPATGAQAGAPGDNPGPGPRDPGPR